MDFPSLADVGAVDAATACRDAWTSALLAASRHARPIVTTGVETAKPPKNLTDVASTDFAPADLSTSKMTTAPVTGKLHSGVNPHKAEPHSLQQRPVAAAAAGRNGGGPAPATGGNGKPLPASLEEAVASERARARLAASDGSDFCAAREALRTAVGLAVRGGFDRAADAATADQLARLARIGAGAGGGMGASRSLFSQSSRHSDDAAITSDSQHLFLRRALEAAVAALQSSPLAGNPETSNLATGADDIFVAQRPTAGVHRLPLAHPSAHPSHQNSARHGVAAGAGAGASVLTSQMLGVSSTASAASHNSGSRPNSGRGLGAAATYNSSSNGGVDSDNRTAAAATSREIYVAVPEIAGFLAAAANDTSGTVTPNAIHGPVSQKVVVSLPHHHASTRDATTGRKRGASSGPQAAGAAVSASNVFMSDSRGVTACASLAAAAGSSAQWITPSAELLASPYYQALAPCRAAPLPAVADALADIATNGAAGIGAATGPARLGVIAEGRAGGGGLGNALSDTDAGSVPPLNGSAYPEESGPTSTATAHDNASNNNSQQRRRGGQYAPLDTAALAHRATPFLKIDGGGAPLVPVQFQKLYDDFRTVSAALLVLVEGQLQAEETRRRREEEEETNELAMDGGSRPLTATNEATADLCAKCGGPTRAVADPGNALDNGNGVGGGLNSTVASNDEDDGSAALATAAGRQLSHSVVTFIAADQDGNDVQTARTSELGGGGVGKPVPVPVAAKRLPPSSVAKALPRPELPPGVTLLATAPMAGLTSTSSAEASDASPTRVGASAQAGINNTAGGNSIARPTSSLLNHSSHLVSSGAHDAAHDSSIFTTSRNDGGSGAPTAAAVGGTFTESALVVGACESFVRKCRELTQDIEHGLSNVSPFVVRLGLARFGEGSATAAMAASTKPGSFFNGPAFARAANAVIAEAEAAVAALERGGAPATFDRTTLAMQNDNKNKLAAIDATLQKRGGSRNGEAKVDVTTVSRVTSEMRMPPPPAAPRTTSIVDDMDVLFRRLEQLRLTLSTFFDFFASTEELNRLQASAAKQVEAALPFVNLLKPDERGVVVKGALQSVETSLEYSVSKRFVNFARRRVKAGLASQLAAQQMQQLAEMAQREHIQVLDYVALVQQRRPGSHLGSRGANILSASVAMSSAMTTARPGTSGSMGGGAPRASGVAGVNGATAMTISEESAGATTTGTVPGFGATAAAAGVTLVTSGSHAGGSSYDLHRVHTGTNLPTAAVAANSPFVVSRCPAFLQTFALANPQIVAGLHKSAATGTATDGLSVLEDPGCVIAVYNHYRNQRDAKLRALAGTNVVPERVQISTQEMHDVVEGTLQRFWQEWRFAWEERRRQHTTSALRQLSIAAPHISDVIGAYADVVGQREALGTATASTAAPFMNQGGLRAMQSHERAAVKVEAGVTQWLENFNSRKRLVLGGVLQRYRDQQAAVRAHVLSVAGAYPGVPTGANGLLSSLFDDTRTLGANSLSAGGGHLVLADLDGTHSHGSPMGSRPLSRAAAAVPLNSTLMMFGDHHTSVPRDRLPSIHGALPPRELDRTLGTTTVLGGGAGTAKYHEQQLVSAAAAATAAYEAAALVRGSFTQLSASTTEMARWLVLEGQDTLAARFLNNTSNASASAPVASAKKRSGTGHSVSGGVSSPTATVHPGGIQPSPPDNYETDHERVVAAGVAASVAAEAVLRGEQLHFAVALAAVAEPKYKDAAAAILEWASAKLQRDAAAAAGGGLSSTRNGGAAAVARRRLFQELDLAAGQLSHAHGGTTLAAAMMNTSLSPSHGPGISSPLPALRDEASPPLGRLAQPPIVAPHFQASPNGTASQHHKPVVSSPTDLTLTMGAFSLDGTANAVMASSSGGAGAVNAGGERGTENDVVATLPAVLVARSGHTPSPQRGRVFAQTPQPMYSNGGTAGGGGGGVTVTAAAAALLQGPSAFAGGRHPKIGAPVLAGRAVGGNKRL